MFPSSQPGTLRRHRGMLALAAGASILSLALSGCSSAGSGQPKADAADATLVAYTGQAGDYQINFNPFSPSQIAGPGTIFEPLFYLNKAAKDAKPEPLLGTESSWNEDGTALSVTLREGVTWSDGEPFTADDVAFTFNLLKKHPALNSLGFKGEVKVVDNTHITFNFKDSAFVSGPDILTQAVIVPEHLWAKLNPETDVIEKPVGTGAYTLADFKPQAFTLKANPSYWGGEPELKNIRYLALSGNTAGADAIAQGTIDWQTGPIPDIQNVSTNFPDYAKLTVAQSQQVLATCANVKLGCTGAQTDPAVRRAIYLALDRTQLNTLAYENTAAPISPSFALPDTQSQWISQKVQPAVAPETADPQAAAALLEEAGWKKGADGIFAKAGKKLSLTIEVVTGWTDYITAIQTITEQAKAAGIQIQAAQSSWNEWTDKRTKGEFELAIDSLWQGPAPDPYYVYNYFFSSESTAKVGKTSGNNYSRYANDSVDKAINALKTIPFEDSTARQQQYDVIQQQIVADMPYIPVLTGGTTSVWNTAKFTGWPTAEDTYAFPAVWSRLDAAQVFKALKPVQG
ncbi:ABC transporter substrate-binding protein [Glutamicibacter halophytocola]|uniref:ABC transporter substrate-binding protein n=1 Tax=Glutamicibacter halophytocola TaxID=1933880 RepID=UPI000AA24669|nr:ABC transporter substrate-binding protein [Glutamicibacter halophytocola]